MMTKRVSMLLLLFVFCFIQAEQIQAMANIRLLNKDGQLIYQNSSMQAVCDQLYNQNATWTIEIPNGDNIFGFNENIICKNPSKYSTIVIGVSDENNKSIVKTSDIEFSGGFDVRDMTFEYSDIHFTTSDWIVNQKFNPGKLNITNSRFSSSHIQVDLSATISASWFELSPLSFSDKNYILSYTVIGSTFIGNKTGDGINFASRNNIDVSKSKFKFFDNAINIATFYKISLSVKDCHFENNAVDIYTFNDDLYQLTLSDNTYSQFVCTAVPSYRDFPCIYRTANFKIFIIIVILMYLVLWLLRKLISCVPVKDIYIRLGYISTCIAPIVTSVGSILTIVQSSGLAIVFGIGYLILLNLWFLITWYMFKMYSKPKLTEETVFQKIKHYFVVLVYLYVSIVSFTIIVFSMFWALVPVFLSFSIAFGLSMARKKWNLTTEQTALNHDGYNQIP